jgi:integrase
MAQPDPTPRLPKYRHYRPKDLAVVRIDGRDHYLGRYRSDESFRAYKRLVGAWVLATWAPDIDAPPPAPAPASPTKPGAGMTVSELLAAYFKHARAYYRHPDGAPSLELENIKAALGPVRTLYGATPAARFGPRELRAVRDAMVRSGLARTTVNARVNRVRRSFRWGVAEGLVAAGVDEALRAVDGLRPNRSAARETEPIRPVAVEAVEARLPHLPKPVAAMVRLQLLTGARVGEVLIMRGRDLTPGEPTWEYRPACHKNAWRGHRRVIVLGPRAAAIVRDFAREDPAAFLFSPCDVAADLRARGLGGRNSATVAPRCSRRTYRQAIVRGCDKAFPHPTLARADA